MSLLPTTGLTVGGGSVDTRSSYYQDLKSRIHQDLLNRLDLDRLTRMRREDAEPEIRGLIVGMVERESSATPLSLFEREALISDVINELFGLGPLEVLLRDPMVSDILVNRYNQVRRARRKTRRNGCRVQGRPPPHADHRADCQQRRTPDRRVESHGRCAPRRRFPRQRDHPTTRAGRPRDVDSALPD